jgi:hypoxanthine phosphoribosyltransferase
MNLLARSQEVEQKITAIAHDIIAAYPDEKPLFVCLLRGGAPFAAKLMFEITKQAPEFYPELDYMVVSAYGSERHAREPKIVTDLSPKTILQGRDVILLDDALDTGTTAQFTHVHLMKKGARSVRLAVLIQKNVERTLYPAADFYGFTSGPEWLAGMGLDDHATANEAFRWLNEIRILN